MVVVPYRLGVGVLGVRWTAATLQVTATCCKIKSYRYFRIFIRPCDIPVQGVKELKRTKYYRRYPCDGVDYPVLRNYAVSPFSCSVTSKLRDQNSTNRPCTPVVS